MTESLRLAQALAIALAAAAAAEAADFRPINPGDIYDIELCEGPVLGSSRVIGLAGAYSAVAEEAVGIPWNPASVANRTYYSGDLFDWNLAFDFILGNAFRSGHFDFDNNDRSLKSNLWVIHLGGMLQVGPAGAGAYLRSQNLSLKDGSGREYEGGMLQGQFCLGLALFDHQLVSGLSLRYGSFDIHEKVDRNNKYGLNSTGLELGMLLRPNSQPWRLSFVVFGPMSNEITDISSSPPAGIVLPSGVSVPWELRIGFSYLAGLRQYNMTPLYKRKSAATVSAASGEGAEPAADKKEEEDEDRLDREYKGGNHVLICFELLLQGNGREAIGTDGFFNQEYEDAGRTTTVSPRLGAEIEPLRRRLRVRTGMYWEPGRFKDFSGRLHWTFCVQIRLFDISFLGDYSISASLAWDVTHRYSNVTFGLGFWN